MQHYLLSFFDVIRYPGKRLCWLADVILSIVVEGVSSVGLVQPQLCGQYSQRSPIEGFGLGVASLRSVKFCQIVEALGDIGMLCLKMLFEERSQHRIRLAYKLTTNERIDLFRCMLFKSPI